MKLKLNKDQANKLGLKEGQEIRILESDSKLKLYHGTSFKKLKDIENKGLLSPTGYDSSNWYMLATDFESALFHSNPDKDEKAIVVEFEVPLKTDKQRWKGYPFLWPGYERSSKSTWYALKQPLPRSFLKKIHKVPYNDYLDVKTTKNF